MPPSHPPLDVEKVLREFQGVVPLFPLPSLVLLPDTVVPLRIFEDRYRAMAKDVVEGDRLMGLALLKPGWETQYQGHPPIFDHLCVAHVVQDEVKTDGRHEMWLYGLFRAQVQAELASEPYRKAKVKVLDDVVRDTDRDALDDRMHRALDMIPGYRGLVGHIRKIAFEVRGGGDGPGRIADATAEAARLDAEERYQVLAEPDVLKRFDLLITLLEKRRRHTADGALPPRTDASLN